MGIVDPNLSEIKEIDHPTVEISTFKRRESQATIMAGLLRGFIDEIGYDKAMEIASAAVQEDAITTGKIMADKYGGNSMKELVRVVKEAWVAEDALEITVLEETDQRLSFDVTRCLYAEMYERLGLKEFGYCLSCNRDAPLIKGFNP
jgi:hypothetical protein